MTSARILAIDAGTQSLRAVLFDSEGTVTASATVDPPTIEHPQPGFAQMDPDAFWRALCAACSQLATAAPAQWQHVAAIALSVQRGSMVFVDQQGRATRPAIAWFDQRRTEPLAPLPLTLRLGTRLIGAHSKLQDLRRQAPTNWLAAHEPDCLAHSDKVVLLSAYLNFRLTGQWIDSNASQVGFVPFNFGQRKWYRAGHWRWRALGHLRPAQMPDLRPPGSALGALCSAAAQSLDLPTTTPVVAAATDKACEVLGSGSGDVALSFGTAVTVNVPHPRFRHVERFIPAFPAAARRGFLSEAQLERGFRCVPWFMRRVAPNLREQAALQSVTPETLLEQMLQSTSAGAAGLTALMATDQRFTTDTALLQRNTRQHDKLLAGQEPGVVYRALIETLLLELKRRMARLQRSVGVRPTRVLAAGGGTRSALIRQMTADILGVTVHCPTTAQTTALGAAMCAAAALGWYPSIEAAQAAMAGASVATTPDAVTQRDYGALAESLDGWTATD